MISFAFFVFLLSFFSCSCFTARGSFRFNVHGCKGGLGQASCVDLAFCVQIHDGVAYGPLLQIS